MILRISFKYLLSALALEYSLLTGTVLSSRKIFLHLPFLCLLQWFLCVGGRGGCYPSHPKWPCILIILCSQALQSKLWDGRAEMTKWCVISLWFPLRLNRISMVLICANTVNIITGEGRGTPLKFPDVNNSEHLATHLLESLRSNSSASPCQLLSMPHTVSKTWMRK